MSTWREVPLRAIYQRVELRGRADLPLLSVYRDYGVVPRDERDDNNNRPSEDLSTYKYVRPGDLVVNKMKTWQGSLAVSGHEGIVSPAYFVGRRISEVDNRFMHHLLRSMPLIAEYGARSKGIRPSQWDLPWDEFAAIKVSLPEVHEQRAIADYLDSETARIDALITKKQQMVDALGFRLDAVIREKVLGCGSSACPPWAQSMGIDRNLIRLGSVLRLRQERNDPIRTERILSLTAARGVIPYEEKGDIGNKASEDISRYSIVRVGDIVLNSMNVIIGSVGLSMYEGVLSPVYYVLTPVDESLVDRGFLAYHLRIREFQRQLVRLGYGILEHRLRIPWINLKAQMLALPPLSVQRSVADELVVEEQRHKNLSKRLQDQIDLLRKRRQALITAAVTGEIEIPGEAA